jgi:hypothetical protein
VHVFSRADVGILHHGSHDLLLHRIADGIQKGERLFFNLFKILPPRAGLQGEGLTAVFLQSGSCCSIQGDDIGTARRKEIRTKIESISK